MQPQAIEAAAFEAWPALENETLHGWRLRFARGYTKRANSANGLPGAQELDADGIGAIEARYRARGLPPIFRLTSFGAPPGIDGELAARGYRLVDPSLVMTMPVDADRSAGMPALADDVEAWLDAFEQVSGRIGAGQATHLALLRAIRHPRALALARAGGVPVATALAVLVGDRLGLFDVATHPGHRRQGHAGQLCRELLAWGRAAGARLAYLQVIEANQPAVRLYARMGFRTAYRYWYRVCD